MPRELRPLRRRLRLHKSGLGYAGRIGDRAVIAVVTGMGTALARGAVVRLLDAVDVEWVIVVGITVPAVAFSMIEHPRLLSFRKTDDHVTRKCTVSMNSSARRRTTEDLSV